MIAPFLFAASVSGATNRIFSDRFEAVGYCPIGRITSSDVFFPPSQANLRRSVDLRYFENIWGYNSASGSTPMPWPGIAGSSPVVKNFIREGYIAAQFHTPANLVEGSTGTYKNVSNFSGPDLNASISRTCGEITPVETSCYARNIHASDIALLRWRGGAGTVAYCGLEPDTTYYLNIELTDPDVVHPDCNSKACWMHVLRQ